MANIKSSQKRARQTIVRTERNKTLKSRVKNSRKAVLASLESGDTQKAGEQFRAFASAADKAAKGGVIHKNAASRIIANLAATIAKGGAGVS